MSGLVDLKFIDLMLGPDYCDLKNMASTDGRITPVDDSLADDVSRLRKLCLDTSKERGQSEFTVTFDGSRLRVTGLVDDRDHPIWLISRARAEVMPLEELNLPRPVIDAVMDKNLTGIVLTIGSYGVGKTTTAASMFANRVRDLGGLGLTFEEPPEIDMSGPQGKGRIIQIPVIRHPYCEEILERGVRSRAENFFFGEIRNADNAIEVQYIAVNDRPVFTTIHGETMWQALMKFQALCRKKDSSPEALNMMLAESLSILIHLTLEILPNSAGGQSRRITPRCLVLGKGDHPARAKIRAGDFRGLADEIGSQGCMRSIRAGGDRSTTESSIESGLVRPAWRKI